MILFQLCVHFRRTFIVTFFNLVLFIGEVIYTLTNVLSKPIFQFIHTDFTIIWIRAWCNVSKASINPFPLNLSKKDLFVSSLDNWLILRFFVDLPRDLLVSPLNTDLQNYYPQKADDYTNFKTLHSYVNSWLGWRAWIHC